MTIGQPPATVIDLLAKVRESTGNIAKHRDAMAKVAADIAANQQSQPVKEVTP